MKVLYFNYRDRSKTGRQRKPVNPERLLFNSFLAVFVILLGVQAALLNPSFRAVLTMDENLQGSPLGTEEFLYNEGSIEISLVNLESNSDVRVLVNGEERAVFDSSSITVNVVEGDVVEIDASEATGSVEVKISAISANFDRECLGRAYRAEGRVLKLLKVRTPPR